MDGAEEVGYQTEEYILNELNYSGCQGCNHCKTADECRVDDDSSPIYFHLFSGQFKLMQDRFYSFIDSGFRSRLAPGKKVVIVTSQGHPDISAFEKAADDFAEVLRFLGFEVVDIIRMGGGGPPDAVLDRRDLLDQARSVGSSL